MSNQDAGFNSRPYVAVGSLFALLFAGSGLYFGLSVKAMGPAGIALGFIAAAGVGMLAYTISSIRQRSYGPDGGYMTLLDLVICVASCAMILAFLVPSIASLA